MTRSANGYFKPLDCEPDEKVHIVVPYHERPSELLLFLFIMHGLLQLQRVQYDIVLIEPKGNGLFKRGHLFNAYYMESSKQLSDNSPECLSIHDVDKIPSNLQLRYNCEFRPVQLARQFKTFNFTENGLLQQMNNQKMYPGFMGGATLINRWDYWLLNGFSNLFDGWGGEDDDLFLRTKIARIPISEVDPKIGTFYHWMHSIENAVKDHRRKSKLKLPAVWTNMLMHGLAQTEYSSVEIQSFTLYTKYHVIY
ncbi:hypothetical protein Ciccas_003673 [Cichlidogyrus casuarinus]|uniref:Uncharacterized protein n=1 Tax=Cichlidogyrus casuarinus TaxID=1844966 RepID=A0ABD2QDN7_9PLAT